MRPKSIPRAVARRRGLISLVAMSFRPDGGLIV
jgi:hypothetical protein